jgi:class 3 adenylate cyclase/tetratricopeptide (TPR) repeat protein
MAACPNCGEANPGHARFCLACGSPLAAARGARRETRKTVTVVFCDLIESTPLGEQLDAETYRRVISRYFLEVSGALERHGGTVEKFIGDAVMAVFGIPTLHEDDALRAVRAAVELREAIGGLNEDLHREYGIELGLRTGITTGEVVAGDPAEGQAFATGEAVALAQRLETAAGAGEILIGQPTQRLVRDAVLVEQLEPLDLKGKSEPVAVWRLLGVLTGAPAFARRLDSPLIGRERDLALLEQAFRRARDEQACHLFTVLGAAGVGKSRLVQELCTLLGDEARPLLGRCQPYGEGITFWPLKELVREAASISPQLTTDEARARLVGALAADPEAELVAESLATTAGLAEREATNEEVFWAVRKLLETVAQEQPVVAAFDDLQWAEPTLLDLVEHLADRTRNAPVLLVCMARPELLDERPAWGGGKLNATTILLEPLPDDDVEVLIENLLGETEVSEQVRRSLRETGEGNPLFVEEMLGMLLDEGLLHREDGGGWRARSDLSAVEAPPTIQALLAARIDHLTASERDILERASIVGKLFSRQAIDALVSEGTPLDERLAGLVRKDLIRPDRAAEEGFRFRHVLIRDAAYVGLAKERRAELHERYADWLEHDPRGDRREHEEIVGYHLEQAHGYRAELAPAGERTRTLASRAALLFASAGRRAFFRGDLSAAVGLLTRATVLRRDDPAGRLELAPDLGAALRDTGDLVRADAILSQAIEEAAAAGDRRSGFLALIERARLRLQTDSEGGTDEVLETAEEALNVFRELGDQLGLSRAWSLVANVHWLRCRYAAMEDVLDRALQHAQKAGDRREVARLRNALARAIVLGPTPVQEGLNRCEQILEAARGDRSLEAVVGVMIGSLRAMRGDFDEARRLYRGSRDILEDLGLEVILEAMRTFCGVTELLAGDREAAEHEFRLGYEAFERMGEKGQLSTNAAYLARALSAQGKHVEAHGYTVISEDAASPDDFVSQVVWRQARARSLADREQLEPAERLAREAVALASETDFLAMHADALVDLAEILHAADKLDEARTGLREALAAYEQKGVVVVSEKVRSLLAELDRDLARR